MANVFPPVFHQQTVVAMSLMLLVQSCCSWLLVTAATDALVALDKTRLTVEEGWTGEVTCSRRHGENGTLAWIDPLGHVISVDNRSRIYYNDLSGRLTLRDANLTDSGLYVCAFNLGVGCHDDDDDDGRRCNATLHYRVYVMPDYLVDGVVVLVINGVLIILFIGCLVQSAVSRKQRLKTLYGMHKLHGVP